ncbi:MAG TPA: hypothetical protein VKZ96_00835, partial [Thermomicrobiales bacterium]|nr:hypothetical protein [Thermomicrobiales bacterium]
MVEYISQLLRRRHGVQGTSIYRLAQAVATGRMSWQQALSEARSLRVVSELADGDLIDLERQAQL